MASILIAMELWVTLRKIKIKEVKAIDSRHNCASTAHIQTYPILFVKRNLDLEFGPWPLPVFPLAHNRVDPLGGFIRPGVEGKQG